MTRASRSRWRPVLWTSGVIASVMIAWACNITPLGPYESYDLIVVLENKSSEKDDPSAFFRLAGTLELVEVKPGKSASLKVGAIKPGERRTFVVYAADDPGFLYTTTCEFTGRVSWLDATVEFGGELQEFGLVLRCKRW